MWELFCVRNIGQLDWGFCHLSAAAETKPTNSG